MSKHGNRTSVGRTDFTGRREEPDRPRLRKFLVDFTVGETLRRSERRGTFERRDTGCRRIILWFVRTMDERTSPSHPSHPYSRHSRGVGASVRLDWIESVVDRRDLDSK